MVLLVKIKNPNRKVSPSIGISDYVNAQSPAAESESSSQEYRSAVEQDESPEPPLIQTTTINDSALDDLANALGNAQIDATEVQVLDGKDNGQYQVPLKTNAERPAVDVLIAPAVLGHRWVRTRSNAFVVERPERVRAVSLGVSAILAKHQSHLERDQGRLETLTDHLASLNVQSTTTTNVSGTTNPLAVLLSQCTLSLSQPNAALRMIHALEEEYLSVEEVGQPAAYAMEKHGVQVSSAASLPIPYTTFLDNLCSKAPNKVPAPPAPRSMRYGHSPVKAEDGGSSAELTAESHSSEVPIHLSQGDLYLCGPKEGKVEGASYFSTTVVTKTDEAMEQMSSLSIPDLPQTPKMGSVEAVNDASSENVGEDSWLKGGSRGAIEAALGTSCAAVDRVVCASRNIKPESSNSIRNINVSQLQQTSIADKCDGTTADSSREPALRSFVLVRPPGHHCNATQPSGFCWVNNVAVMAAHAYEEHGIDRVAILDFDLHHGNGTQAIAWRINADTVRRDLEREAKAKAMRAEQERKSRKGRRSGGASGEISQGETTGKEDRRGLKIFYGSLHDIESFPCEDGNKELVTDASMCIEGAHGQWIWNVHLDAHTSPEEAQRLYDAKYSLLLTKASQFFEKTESTPESSLILISAGFDANIHEQAGMQRHGKSVPPRFYEVFTRDTVALADKWTSGKCISVLEGGYSDRALTSGAIAHLAGLGGIAGINEDLYQPSSLYQLEKIAKTAFTQQSSSSSQKRRQDALSKDAVWLDYALEAFRRVEEKCGKKRIISGEAGTAPVTPNRAMMDQLWKSPRETRSAYRGGSASARPSPSK